MLTRVDGFNRLPRCSTRPFNAFQHRDSTRLDGFQSFAEGIRPNDKTTRPNFHHGSAEVGDHADSATVRAPINAFGVTETSSSQTSDGANLRGAVAPPPANGSAAVRSSRQAPSRKASAPDSSDGVPVALRRPHAGTRR